RPFLESRIRSRVLALPNVFTLSARATGLAFRDDMVHAVRYVADRDEQTIDVDFVADAMGRSSKLADWVEQAGFQRPTPQRHRTDINYATALSERSQDTGELPLARCAGPIPRHWPNRRWSNEQSPPMRGGNQPDVRLPRQCAKGCSVSKCPFGLSSSRWANAVSMSSRSARAMSAENPSRTTTRSTAMSL